MLRTYEGILKGNQIDWNGEAPTSERALLVHVTVLDEEGADKKTRGRRMAVALEGLAESGAFASIKDPSEWQREIRRERPLPGRGTE